MVGVDFPVTAAFADFPVRLVALLSRSSRGSPVPSRRSELSFGVIISFVTANTIPRQLQFRRERWIIAS